jgi:hypothetical protein
MNPFLPWIRRATAIVWAIFGAVKVFGLVPRHRLIVAGILGDDVASVATVLIGCAELAMALWILSGVRPRICVAMQTIVIATMNTLEIIMARELLLAPVPMVLANIVLLSAGWYSALQPSRTAQVA